MKRAITAAMPALALLIGEALLVQWHGQLGVVNDASFYVAMAQYPLNPSSYVPPYGWRVLTPLLVHILPLPIDAGFWLLTLLCLAGTIFALQAFLRGLGMSNRAILIGGMVWVTLGPATGYLLYNYHAVDPLSCLLLSAAMACVVWRRGLLLVVVLAGMAFNKELVLLAAIFAVLWAFERRDHAMQRWSVIGLLLSTGVLIGLRVVLPAGQYSIFQFDAIYVDDRAPSKLGAIATTAGTWGTLLSSNWRLVRAIVRAMAATAGTWGILLPVALLALRRPGIMRSWATWILLIGATAQVLVSWDVERVVMYGFPVIIAAVVTEEFRHWVVWALLLLTQSWWWLSFAGWSDYFHILPPDPPHLIFEGIVIVLSVAALAVVVKQSVPEMQRTIDRARQQIQKRLVHASRSSSVD